jgi:hypothetical protein
MRLFVAIPTYKRFELLVNLAAVFLEESKKNDFDICVNVYDNDIDSSAALITSHYADINYVNYPVKGLSNIRNKIISDYRESCCDFLLMIDDDQMITPGFLDIIFESSWIHKYDVISANVKPKFLCARPDWTYNNSVYWDSDNKLYGEVAQIYGAGCVILGNKVKKSKISFRNEFNYLGGEDTAFFTELKNSGFTFYMPKNLISYEIVDERRANYSWFINRCIRIGVSEYFVDRQFNTKFSLTGVIKSLIITCCFFPMFAVSYFFKTRKLNKYTISFLRHVGKLNALFGFFKNSY